jgi:SAM-dependent methyltransferase
MEPSLRNITEILLRHVPSTGKALDVGCGTGRVACRLGARGFEVDAIDIEPRVIDLARGQTTVQGHEKCHFRVCDFRDPAQALLDQYDLITCSEVLEHVVEYERILENIFQSLKRGGRFILTVPCDPKKYSVLDTYDGHVRRFSYEQVLNDLRSYSSRKIVITGFPFYRLLTIVYLAKLRFTGGKHSNEELWSNRSHRLIARLIYPFCRLDNWFAFTRLGGSLIAVADK